MISWNIYKNGCYETSCSIIDDLIDVIDEVYRLDNKILFRGHSKHEEYKLISTIDRSFKNFSKNIEHIQHVEKPTRTEYINLHLSEFRKKIRGKVDSDIFFENDEMTWSLGQHYGLNTPYLDWTEVPYIAAFFCANSNPDIDGCIYALDVNQINKMNEESRYNDNLYYFINDKKQKDFELNIIQPMTNFNTRLNAQNGCFTQTPNGISIDDWINTFENFKEEKVLRKIIIKAELKYPLINFLEKANLNYSTIYPDLQGISMYCNERLRKVEKDTKSKLELDSLMINLKDLDKKVRYFTKKGNK